MKAAAYFYKHSSWMTFAFLSACGPSAPGPDASPDLVQTDASDAGDTPSEGGAPTVTHRFHLETWEQFTALASPQQELKLLVSAPAGALPGSLSGHACVFQDSQRFPFHLQFLQSLPELQGYTDLQYAQATQSRATRVFAPGSFYWFPRVRHPSGSAGVMAYTLSVMSTEAPDTVEAWADYDTRLASCTDLPGPGSDLVLVGVDPTQEAWLLGHRTELGALGVTVMSRAELSANTVEVYSAGETYGYVHTLAPGEEALNYGPRDILIADAARDDLGVLSALITTFPQSFGSHFNLRMREKHLPNLRWAGVRTSPELPPLEGALVHFTVNDAGTMTWTRATLADAEAFWRMSRPVLPAPSSDLTVTELRPMAQLEHAAATAYGVKAANLGEIYDALPAPHRPDGFGIPFSAYASHISQNALQPAIDAVLADPMVYTDRLVREAKLDALRRQIARAPLDPALFTRLADQLRVSFGAGADTLYVRFRSSTNAEDLEEFSGAGLYDSKTGCLADDLDGDTVGPSRCLTPEYRDVLLARKTAYEAELVAHPERLWLQALIDDLAGDLADEKPMADALRKVWRSLWNLRAFEEREYYGVDHRLVFMGVAVVPTMVMERSESVALTNLPHGSDTTGLYRVVSQRDEIGVVQPSIPTATPEEMTFLRAGTEPTNFVVVQRSSEAPDHDLFTVTERETVGRLLLQLHDHFATRVYPELLPLRLDVEFDVNSLGQAVFKQARPYLGTAP